MKVLLTGGAGYIGSHTALELLAAGYEPVLLDNFFNSSAGALAALAGRELPFVAGDVRDGRALDGVFDRHHFPEPSHSGHPGSDTPSARRVRARQTW